MDYTLPEIPKLEKLNLELDLRLNYVIGLAEDEEWDLNRNQILALLRIAYANGYQDALKEESAGQLLKDVPGYRITGRRR